MATIKNFFILARQFADVRGKNALYPATMPVPQAAFIAPRQRGHHLGAPIT